MSSTSAPPAPPKEIREEVWHEVRCPKCGAYLFELPRGGKGRSTCRKCKITVIREIPERKVA